MKKIIPIILCGGSGSRLWPLSRQNMPKQFLSLLGENTLLQETALRAISVLGCYPDELVTVTLSDMHKQTEDQLSSIDPRLAKHILTEPIARNTAAAVAYASHYVWEVFGEAAYAWVLPADHHIGDVEGLRIAVEHALKVAEKDYLVTFGVKPTRPETGYGYIEMDTPINPTAHNVKEFVEKPPQELAEQYVESGQYLWSSGMHLFKINKVLKAYHQYANESILLVGEAMLNENSKQTPSLEKYGQIKSEPFETAVMEKTGHVAVIPCDIQWSDIGSFCSLWETSKDKDENGNVVNGSVLCHNTKDSMVYAKSRTVACVGLKDVVIVETSDSILVADKNNGDQIKFAVKAMEKKNEKIVRSSDTHFYNWGHTKVLSKTGGRITTEVVVKAGKKRCFHMLVNASKLCTVVSGKAMLFKDKERLLIEEQKNFYIERQTPHTILNAGNKDLYLIEIQYGISDNVAEPVRVDVPDRLSA